jgi:hypothetical protein
MSSFQRHAAPVALLAFVLVGAGSAAAQEHKKHKNPVHDKTTSGHSHEMAEVHGGRVTMTPNHHFEVLFTSDEARVYSYDESQQLIEAHKEVTVALTLKSKRGGDVTLPMDYVAPDPENGRAQGYFSAAHDFGDIEKDEMKAIFLIAGLAAKPIEFKTSVMLSEPAVYLCPMNDSPAAAEPGACPKCGMEMVRQKSEKAEHGHSGHEHSGHDSHNQ